MMSANTWLIAASRQKVANISNELFMMCWIHNPFNIVYSEILQYYPYSSKDFILTLNFLAQVNDNIWKICQLRHSFIICIQFCLLVRPSTVKNAFTSSLSSKRLINTFPRDSHICIQQECRVSRFYLLTKWCSDTDKRSPFDKVDFY